MLSSADEGRQRRSHEEFCSRFSVWGSGLRNVCASPCGHDHGFVRRLFAHGAKRPGMVNQQFLLVDDHEPARASLGLLLRMLFRNQVLALSFESE